jgi:hypothetical protein
MRWLLLFLVSCGGSDAGLLNPGEASAPETSVNTDTDGSQRADSPSTDATPSTDVTTSVGFDASTTTTTITDASEKQTTDANILDVVEPDAGYVCNLTCEPMCIRLMHPMRACCSPNQQCHCTLAEAGSTCGP